MNNYSIIHPRREEAPLGKLASAPSGFLQYGMTLIELMVALTIGLFLLLVISNLFIGSKQTYRNQDNLSRLQENGRFAMALLGKNIREAGYHNISFNGPSSMYIKGAINSQWPFGALVIKGTDGGTGNPDSIALSTDSSLDCLNTAVATPATNTFAINSSAQLTCVGSGGATSGVILDGVEDMQILYGENLGTAHRYVDASTASINWGNVDTVRICLLLRTTEAGLTVKPQAYTDCTGASSVTKTDGRIRQAFSDTITIRSRIP